ncbi:MAG: type II and III secretion system protein family protein [Candidatus Dormibacteria bacterium]
MTGRTRRVLASAVMAAVATAPLGAQTTAPASTVAAATQISASAITAGAAFPTLLVVAGGSTVVQTEFPVTRIAVTNPDIADARVIDPRQVLVDGKASGTVSLIVWGQKDMLQYAVNVFPATPTLQRQFQLLFPGEDLHVSVADEAIVLSGKVTSRDIAMHAVDIAAKSSAKSKVVNLLQIPGENQGQQVMLQVRVAEVSQRALLELGSSFFTGPNGYKQWTGRVSTEQFPTPQFENRVGPPPPSRPQDEGKLSFSDFLNLFVLNTKYDVGAVITALRARGFFQSLAEPTLIAYNGQEASFLAGGEVPVPVVQGVSGAVSIVYKEFGVRLTFRPDITGDVIRMKVRPEVSSLDFANGVTLGGFRVPALTTRRAETDVELRDGQSFAIGGLLNNMSQTDRSAIPLLGDLPIVGYLFKSKAERKERTELVVIITPHLVQPLNAGQALPMPTLPQQFLPPAGTTRETLQP